MRDVEFVFFARRYTEAVRPFISMVKHKPDFTIINFEVKLNNNKSMNSISYL